MFSRFLSTTAIPKIIVGSMDGDDLAGSEGRDIILGLRGDDVISSGGGDDRVFAGSGKDTIIAGSGDNRYDGGTGRDTVRYAGSAADYEISTPTHWWQPTTITRLHTAPEGAGTDVILRVEALYFAADDYTLNLDGTNNAVLARNDSVSTDEDTALTLDAADLTANDAEFDGDAISVTSVDATSAAGASVSLADGVISYDHAGLFDALAAGETAQDTFSYTADDGLGGTDTATVTVTITGVNDAPSIIAPVSVSYAENGTDPVAVIDSADLDSTDLSYAISGGADAALFAIDAATGALSFIAAPDFEAPGDADGDNSYAVEVSVTDGDLSDSAAVTVNVTDVEEISLVISEIMYNPGTSEPAGEWVELYNAGASDVDLTGFVIDDINGTAHSGANIAGGVIAAGETAVLFNADSSSAATFAAQWGEGVTLIAVTNWSAMSLNNSGDTVSVWSSFDAYDGDHATHANAIATVAYDDSGDWPADDGSGSIYLTDLTADPNDGANWALSSDGAATPAGDTYVSTEGDVGSPGGMFAPAVVLNELAVNTSGTDWEFAELYGEPGHSLDGLTLVVVRGDDSTVGSVYRAFDLTGHEIGANGYFLLASPQAELTFGLTADYAIGNDSFVNDTSTFLLVQDFTGAVGDDLDTDDDGNLDITPYGAVLDSVALIDATADDRAYSGAVVGPDGSYMAAGATRSPDGTGDWVMTDFSDEATYSPTVAEVALVADARLNEIHYDNAGADVGEFVEVRVNAGADVSGLSVALYNGSNGADYDSAALSTMEMTTDGTFDYYVWSPSSIQNGAPDGFALIEAGTVVEFLSYEGTMTATSGAAAGMTSTDIGVAETSSTDLGQSLWRDADGVWQGPADETPGEANDDGGSGGGATEALISAVQGSGDGGAMVGETVIVEAIVVGDFQDGDADTLRDLQGFFLQEEAADSDGDASTSEGIFVYEGTGDFITDVALGDRVLVTGVVSEYFGQTQIVATGVEVIAAGAVSDVNTMAAHISVDGIDAVTTDDSGNYVPDLEAYEGMLVTIDDTLTVNELYQLDRFNEMRLTAGDRPEQFTQSNDPDVAAYDAYQQQTGSDEIVYDDGLNFQNQSILSDVDLNGDGVFDTSDGFTMGDTVTGLTGVIGYSWAGSSSSPATWRVRSVEEGANTFVDTDTREDTVPAVGGDLKVVSFNVLNYFVTIDASGASTDLGFDPRGADTAEEFARQTEKLVGTLLDTDADVFGLVELENQFAEGASDNAIATLVSEMNATLGSDIYDWVRPGADHVGDDAIAVGMIYDASAVSVVPGTVDYLTDADLDALGYGALDDDGLGVFEGAGTNRSPLTAEFIDLGTGEDFSVTVTHMKSKGSGEGTNADIGDGAGASNEMRSEGVEVMQAWLDARADADSLVLGDFNAYAAEDPIDLMAAEGYVNLEEFFNPGATTYVFDGQTGTLDYAFGSSDIMDNVTGAEAWHINSSEPGAIDYNTDFGRDTAMFDGDVPYRTSDHDPIIVGLDFDPVLVVA
ncbi:ExeM/NucH family extracellular endonuclease [Aliiroseovarius sp. PTFE2010]|uniref:ExeM/NucH family extracellular endonuclease n=1 Tax=Aliiroseovarius sp. PTFE2010 TaxID=3417190 RepID=UPI003CE7DAA8